MKHKLTSRREFARQAAAAASAAASTALSASSSNAQSDEAKPSPLEQAYFEHVRARFGSQLSAGQLAQIKKDVAGNLRTQERLRSIKLQNSDEPDFTFNA